MRKRPILFSAIAITIIVELVLMILVYNKIGADRLSIQFFRLIIQSILIAFIIANSKRALFILTAYHIFSGMYGLYTPKADFLFSMYHIIIGIVIYFHDWIESKIGIKT